MKKDTRVSVKPTIQADGALLIEVWTDGYATAKDFFDAGGPQSAMQAVLEGIRLGHITDLRVIQFCQGPIGGKNIDFRLLRHDGTEIAATLPKGYEVEGGGLTLSFKGKMAFH
jgi:hypothetical protein